MESYRWNVQAKNHVKIEVKFDVTRPSHVSFNRVSSNVTCPAISIRVIPNVFFDRSYLPFSDQPSENYSIYMPISIRIHLVSETKLLFVLTFIIKYKNRGFILSHNAYCCQLDIIYKLLSPQVRLHVGAPLPLWASLFLSRSHRWRVFGTGCNPSGSLR